MKFNLLSAFKPTGDQPQAINSLVEGINKGIKNQVLVGVTGSGKTFTMANVIAEIGRPALVISHNKTLAAQLYQEFRDFFPHNAVSYFVSYYDYYQPEAYIPQTDTYIEKETEINEEIDKLRLAATTNILTRPDTIIVASVSCIYNIGSPREYGHFVLEIKPGIKISRNQLMIRLIQLQYERNDFDFNRGSFRVRGETTDIYPAYEDTVIRIVCENGYVNLLEKLDAVSGRKISDLESVFIYPAKHYMTDPKNYPGVFNKIRSDLSKQEAKFRQEGKILEAHRISQRVNYDLEMISEMGYVNGIENYSRYFDGRKPGSPPYTLFDYFYEARGGNKNGFLLFIDESHMTIPQIRGMYNGDRSRKQTLIDYGFRLPAALDNRPLRFDEFLRITPQTVFVSATPDDWEMSQAIESASALSIRKNRKPAGIVEQLIRPTGLVDPQIEIRPAVTQVDDLISEINKRIVRHERCLVTALTKKMSEDLAKYLESTGIGVHYLHSEILTLERSDILDDLRGGKYDVIVGVNLLREGLDLPEVSLVAVLNADKEGFLRSRISLIQTMGRASRHISGRVILYADNITKSMREAIDEVNRRRQIQIRYNRKNRITPVSITKPIRARLVEKNADREKGDDIYKYVTKDRLASLTPMDKKKLISKLKRRMMNASHDLLFEEAARIRDIITGIQEDI